MLGGQELYLQRLTGRRGNLLQDMVNDPIIVELKNGKVYGGKLDRYCYYHSTGGGVVVLYDCKLLSQDEKKWIDHDILKKYEKKGELVRKSLPDFWMTDIKDIWILPPKYIDKLSFEDTLQIYIDPHYKPPMGVECNWGFLKENMEIEDRHTPACDARLHEALHILRKEAFEGVESAPKVQYKERNRKRKEAYAYIRRRLLSYGAKIP